MVAATLGFCSSGRPPPLPELADAQKQPRNLSGRRVLFTTPSNYAVRLARMLTLRGATAISTPPVVVELTPRTMAAMRLHLSQDALASTSAIAFTSRSGISAAAAALPSSPPLSSTGEDFTVAALGADVELLHSLNFATKLSANPNRIRVLVPDTATPSALVHALGSGSGNRILCPVPEVVGLEEPPVVPNFLDNLRAAGWIPVRIPAYETRWMGPRCAEKLVTMDGEVDAIIFTSSAEVEGLLKGLEKIGWDWERVKRRWPRIVVAAHGPVTAACTERLGVAVDLIGAKFGTFDGVLDAMAARFSKDAGERISHQHSSCS